MIPNKAPKHGTTELMHIYSTKESNETWMNSISIQK